MMKKITSLIILVIFLLAFPTASASFFDWMTGGEAVEIIPEPTTLSEQITCNFYTSDATQKCYTNDGAFSCTGISSCTVSVSGEKDKQLYWKSSCSGEATTFIDGKEENPSFKCEQIQPTPAPLPTQPAIEEVKEQIKCLFINSASPQKCYTSDGKFSCSGTGSCDTGVYGAKGTRLYWKSSCGSEFSTLLDGAGEELSFKCEQVQPIPTTTPTITPTPVMGMIKENIRCFFTNSNSLQKCYTDDGKFSCSGSDGCEVWVSGEKGKSLNWKSSCSGSFSTILTGGTKDLTFNCEQTPYPIPIPTPIPTPTPIPQPTQPVQPIPTLVPTQPSTEIKEVVKCIFTDSDAGQFCYTDDKRYGCKGIGTCVMEFSGKPGEKLNWRSSCEGSVSTVVDGLTDYISFKCAQAPLPQPTPTQPLPMLPTVKEKVKCLFVNSQTPQQCLNEYPDSGCKGIGSCLDENVVGEQGKKMVWKSTCGGGYTYTVMDGQDEYIEFICPLSTTPTTAQELVACIFDNADTAQKCYSDDGKYSCSLPDEFYTKKVDGQEVKYSACKMDVSGTQGQKLTWKSSCGEYAYTVIDGSPEEAEFQCLPSTEVKKEQISGKGFKGAYWQCYDGMEKPPVVSVSPACKSSEAWQQEASEFCNAHCREDTELGVTKCGVNSFSVTESCYFEYGKEGVEFILPPEHTFKEETSPEGFFVPNDGVLLYFYIDECRYCQEMNKIMDTVGSKLGVPVGHIDFANYSYYGSMIDKMGITGVPTIVYKRSDERFIKRVGPADAETIISWLTGKEIGERTGKEEAFVGKPIELPREKKEEILFCKDSCPKDGKCYPFGYRKEGKFCSDSGAFTEQSVGDSACDNNFECSSNVCVSGKCISSGMMEKIISWFKSLFGGGEV